ncbi:MAG: YciI family protein [Defluviicoccus sp.]|nr:MAG: YciI family protein [Defluviicoccus sp.]
MHFVFYCRDKTGNEHVRTSNRSAHLDYLRATATRLLCAGPLLEDVDGTHMIGSLLVLDLPDRAAADAFAANDPYAKAGLFESVTIHPWRKVFPKG